MPLSTTTVIGSGWAAHHAAVVAGTMTATCDITRSGHGPFVFDEVAGRSVPPAPTPLYSGACRIVHAVRPGQTLQVGEKPTVVQRYVVSVPLTVAPVHANDVVAMTSATDMSMVGLRLRVIHVRVGSLSWERDLDCELHETTSR